MRGLGVGAPGDDYKFGDIGLGMQTGTLTAGHIGVGLPTLLTSALDDNGLTPQPTAKRSRLGDVIHRGEPHAAPSNAAGAGAGAVGYTSKQEMEDFASLTRFRFDSMKGTVDSLSEEVQRGTDNIARLRADIVAATTFRDGKSPAVPGEHTAAERGSILAGDKRAEEQHASVIAKCDALERKQDHLAASVKDTQAQMAQLMDRVTHSQLNYTSQLDAKLAAFLTLHMAAFQKEVVSVVAQQVQVAVTAVSEGATSVSASKPDSETADASATGRKAAAAAGKAALSSLETSGGPVNNKRHPKPKTRT